MHRRAAYAALASATIAVGLAVHRGAFPPDAVARDVLGDALWAAMMTWIVGALAPAAPLRARGAAALAVCWLVEASQLVHAPALDALRRTVAGRLVLGSGFDPRDLAAYAAGVLVALLGETLLVRARGRDGRSLPPPTT